ncbi:MAG: 3-phosphoshikimate 1-carboxyvinyltransferase [Bacteroidetes bacterium]|nr:3-phosphoshikimate 1-carboxyvinyltransferase [Bacteroidota bacterium]MBU1578819.1 3-phosphoshikimate 1-carboxyvinyltransferase [Bacteroidota bacterium]MBU2557315.1 3-phosphoshikimate 1-carboxyvinyltransferase [Bacteroidota bacterium]
MVNHKKLTANKSVYKAAVQLSSSKSESNRALMIRAYGGFDRQIRQLSDADDTVLLKRNLKMIQECANSSIPLVIDCGNAGTAFRFLVSYLASTPGKWMLTGSPRMLERPIGELVDALRSLGAEIEYTGERGFPPLRILGKQLHGGKVALSIAQSSQFASSLLLAAPSWQSGLEIELVGQQSSLPYLEMTLSMMRYFKAEVEWRDNHILVAPKPYENVTYTVQADWSSASYWYELVALSERGELLLQQLDMDSLQGDKVLVDLFEKFGVHSHQEPEGVRIFKQEGYNPDSFVFDFKDSPDLLPTIAATCAGLSIEGHFTGLKNLVIKESDRTFAMKSELQKIDVKLEALSEDAYKLTPAPKLLGYTKADAVVFETWGDHRMAMALAPLASKLGAIQINNPAVVSKSYPAYWSVLRKTAILK